MWHGITHKYDPLGRLVDTIDDLGNNWHYEYDSLGRRVLSRDPDMGTWTFSYDPVGRLQTQTDAKLQTTHFKYDQLGRMVSRTIGDDVSAWYYDESRAPDTNRFGNVGHLTSQARGGVRATFDYDKTGNLVHRQLDMSGKVFEFDYAYDVAGRLLWLRYPDGDSLGSASTPFLYDPAGRLASIPGIVSQIEYSAAGEVEGLRYANGSTVGYGRDAARGWVKDITAKAVTGAPILGLSYRYLPNGDVAGVDSTNIEECCNYGYDGMNRLTTVTCNGGLPPLLHQGSDRLIVPSQLVAVFAYDSLGNILVNLDSGVGDYVYPQPRQPLPHAPSTIGGNEYKYDANGNTTSGAGWTYRWDAENRLIGLNDATFAYDANGVRVRKTHGVDTLYLGDGVEVRGGELTKYVTVGGVNIAKRVAGGTVFLYSDRLGSIVVEEDQGGKLTAETYSPYGRPATGALLGGRGFTGHMMDDTGLIFMNARYYDPRIARFISPDPSMPSGTPIALNRYAYASDSPLRFVDLTGYATEPPPTVETITVVGHPRPQPDWAAFLRYARAMHAGRVSRAQLRREFRSFQDLQFLRGADEPVHRETAWDDQPPTTEPEPTAPSPLQNLLNNPDIRDICDIAPCEAVLAILNIFERHKADIIRYVKENTEPYKNFETNVQNYYRP